MSAAVVNHLHFTDPVDPALFERGTTELGDAMRGVDGFEAFHVVRTGEREVILVILADTAETLDRIATEVGSPWMREHVVPLLAGPPERHIGPALLSVRA